MYPVWYVPFVTSGWVLGMIAAFHILPSHLSVGAMWFTVYAEYRALKENNPAYLAFVRKFTLFLLVFSYILGSLTGVGIWFSASVVSPRGISALIHNYVWGWATEWCFFILEVVGIYLYYYTLDRISPRLHLKLGILFGLSSWITMVIITGILAFQLTPGKFLETGGFFDGFFNPTYWPQLFLRTSLMLAIAAGWALLINGFVKDKEVTRKMSRWAGFLGLVGIILGVVFLTWYTHVLPKEVLEVFQGLSMAPLYKAARFSLIVTFLYFLFHVIKPLRTHWVPAILGLLVIFTGIWSGERMREIARKPYVVRDYITSSQWVRGEIPAKNIASEEELLSSHGYFSFPLLQNKGKALLEKNPLLAGKLLALYQCSPCHALSKKGVRPMGKMLGRLGFSEKEELMDFLDMLREYPYMPPFAGNEEEKEALAEYLTTLLP